MRYKQAVLIFNPKSGRGQATLRARDFSERWKERTGEELRLRATRNLPDIREAARETYTEDEIQIFMGGDGTLSESMQGLAEANEFERIPRPVGFLPGGTGNSFLRDFGITDYNEARDALFAALETGEFINVDSSIVHYQKFDPDHPLNPGADTLRLSFNIWGVGLIGDITELAIRMRYIGSANYTVASLIKLLGHKPYSFDARIDEGEEETIQCNMITVSNSRYTGGAMCIAPEVRVNDGRLFMVMSNIPGRFKLLRTFPKIFDGSHTEVEEISSQFIRDLKLKSKRPFLMNVDGELEKGFNPHLRIEPGFFKLFMPRDRLTESE